MISRCSFRRGWPTKSARRRGRSVVSSARSTGSAAGWSSSSRTTAASDPGAGEAAQGVAEQLLGGVIVVETGEGVAHLVGVVPEAGERVADLPPDRGVAVAVGGGAGR